MSSNAKIELTGNPFVDAGLGAIASLTGLNDITELALEHLKSVYNDGGAVKRVERINL